MTVVEANSVSQSLRPRSDMQDALSEIIEHYRDPEAAIDELKVLEHAATVGEGALVALAGHQYRHVQEVHHNDAFPLQRPRTGSVAPYIVGITTTPERSVVYLDHEHAGSQATVGIVSVPKGRLHMPMFTPEVETVFTRFRGEQYSPTEDPHHFGRMMATGASWLLRALR